MKERIILKSAKPEEYDELVIECRVIENSKIGEYVSKINPERKLVGFKKGRVSARLGNPGEEIHTVLVTEVDGKKYILGEESNTVQLRKQSDGTEMPDVVVTNTSSTSNEQYIVKYARFIETYTLDEETGEYIPAYDPRELAQVDEDIMIETAWGSRAICLKGSFIVTYNAESNDYNTLEQGAFDSTYEEEKDQTQKLRKI